MLRHSSIPLHFSPFQHARIWLVLAVVFFSLAAGSRYWNEVVQYHIYLTIGLVLAGLAVAPLLIQIFQGRAK